MEHAVIAMAKLTGFGVKFSMFILQFAFFNLNGKE
jgi:hypothetical protein